MAAPQWALLERHSQLVSIVAIFAFVISCIATYRTITKLLALQYQNEGTGFKEFGLKLIEDEWRISPTKEDYGDCSSIWNTENGSRSPITYRAKMQGIGAGWNKNVYEMEGSALKVVNLKGEGLQKCLELFSQTANCVTEAAKAFVKEIILLNALQNDLNIPKLFAYCIPSNPEYNIEKLAILVEKGIPLDIIYLLQLNWHQRVEILSEILLLLERVHPYVFNDIRRQQFIIVNKRPMLADLDDVSVEDSSFEDNVHTARQSYSSFIKVLLLDDKPASAQMHLHALKESLENNTMTMGLLKQKVGFLKAIR